ncbi:MAG TPA: hypothetical protein V6C97_03255 [Oculatellaceae cyanobacterium]
MVEISLQHIIGTVALIGLVISASLFYTLFTGSVQDDSRKKQLGQISESVALNIEEMINLAKFSKYSTGYMVKTFDLPTAVGDQPYKVQLMNDSVKGVYVHTYLASQPTVAADSTIPYNSADTPIRVETTASTYKIEAGADNTTITCSGIIYGKSSSAVWANLNWTSTENTPDLITIGLGWLSG